MSFLARHQGSPRIILILPVLRGVENGWQICGRAEKLESWSCTIIAKSCFLPSTYTASLPSPFIPEGMGLLGISLSFPYFFFLSSFLTLTSKKKDHTIKRSLGFYFQIPFSMDRTKNQWNNQASHPIMQQMVKLFVSVNCGFHSSEGCFPPGDSSNWTN